MKTEGFETEDDRPDLPTPDCPAHLFDIPRVIRKSQPLPSLMHLCSYASCHTEGSTCNLYGGEDLGVRSRRPPTGGAE
jgi:hypothetical protein